MKSKIAYIGLDVHVRNCVLTVIDERGNIIAEHEFTTSAEKLIDILKSVEAKEKYFAVEECMLAAWVANTAKPYVNEVLVADPRENAWISRNPHKNDKEDARRLCRLLRMGELKRVYHAENDRRALFKAAAQHYIDMRNQQVTLKQKIKAMYRHWGIIEVEGKKVYSPQGRQEYMEKMPHIVVRHQLHRLYALMDEAERSEATAARELRQLGRSYPEVREWKKIPGIGPIIALLFNALIQTPHRFADKRKLWRYCRLGITDRSSDGKPLGFKRLDHSGIGDLKSLSYWAWMAAMKSNNEVRRFYENSLARTHNHVHARLNTQRKILAVMYGLWKKGGVYRPECFLGLSVV